MKRASILPLAAVSLLVSVYPALGEPTAFHEPNAVLVNLTESDLNGLLRELFLSAGGPRIDGVREQLDKGISDLRYEAELSEPVLGLSEGGRLSLGFHIRQADVKIGRLERRIGKRVAHCENTGVAVDPEHPVEFRVDFRFQVGGGELRVLPESVRLDNARKDIRLVRPTHCEKAILPKWLLWWIGKSRLRRQLAELDEVLLARALRGAEDLNGSEGLIREHWEGKGGELHLYPRDLRTDQGALTLFLAGSDRGYGPDLGEAPRWLEEKRGSSFLAVSEALLNEWLLLTFPEGAAEPRKPSGLLRKLFRSRSLYTLVPGLREFDPHELYFTLTCSPPRIELETVPASVADLDPTVVREAAPPGQPRALVRIRMSGIELHVWKFLEEERELLGTLRIDSGRVGVVPYVNLLGGISFEPVENEWKLSSAGIEFRERVLAAMIQEMVFGETFQTKFEPLAREAFRIGEAELAPRGISVVGDHLVIEMGAGPLPAPTQTDTLLASR